MEEKIQQLELSHLIQHQFEILNFQNGEFYFIPTRAMVSSQLLSTESLKILRSKYGIYQAEGFSARL
jgi:hypothetical protein